MKWEMKVKAWERKIPNHINQTRNDIMAGFRKKWCILLQNLLENILIFLHSTTSQPHVAVSWPAVQPTGA
jgi:hypothetical protein